MLAERFKILTEDFDFQLSQVDSTFRPSAPALIVKNEGVVFNRIQERKECGVVETGAPVQKEQGLSALRLASTADQIVYVSAVDG